jgi:predicted transcriptional regulator
MGEHKQKLYSFRTDDELIEKLNIIAEKHSRTRNKEIEYALKKYVEQYEQEEGRINNSKLSVTKIS